MDWMVRETHPQRAGQVTWMTEMDTRAALPPPPRPTQLPALPWWRRRLLLLPRGALCGRGRERC